MGEVTREDAIRFCNAAMRNWQYVSFDEDELEDLRVELQRRLTTAQTEIEALRAEIEAQAETSKRALAAAEKAMREANERAEEAEALREALARIDQQVAHGKLGDWHIALTEIRDIVRAALSGSQT